MKAEDVREGAVFLGNAGYRRVIGLLQGRVVYTTQREKKRDCKLKTLLRWIARNRADVWNRRDA